MSAKKVWARSLCYLSSHAAVCQAMASASRSSHICTGALVLPKEAPVPRQLSFSFRPPVAYAPPLLLVPGSPHRAYRR